MFEYGLGNRGFRAARMVVEGYPPDESLRWDETIHITFI